MRRRDFIEAINAPVRDVLVRARAGISIEQAAEALGTSPKRLRYIEANPARIPCSDLYRIFQHLRPELLGDVEKALIAAQFTGFQYRSQRTSISRRLDLWTLRFRLWSFQAFTLMRRQFAKDWPLILGLLSGRAIADFAMSLYRK